ncbi:MAG: deoxyhypusine synthase family protein [Candidatus Kerfeldbacteria bacterium]|nr:deoxyhypusine synthase family protein [Candidatus Kerfeldbacteria bacterium]
MEENPYKKELRQPFDPAQGKDDLTAWKDKAFQARGLGEVADVWEETITRPKMVNFLGYAASLSSAGLWPGIRWLVENRMVDVLVATGANLTEDVYEAMGFQYWKVDPWFPDDNDLLAHRMDRFYDHAADEWDYRKMELLVIKFIEELNNSLKEQTVFPTWKLLHEFGKWQLQQGIRSITAVAAEKKIPVFCPALVDSGFGEAYVWALSDIPRKQRKLIVEQFWDAEDIFQIAEWALKEGREKTAGYIGGGVPKDFTQLVAVSQSVVRPSKTEEDKYAVAGDENDVIYPYKYSFQITTDSPQWGSLSGCGVMTEPISWGKQANGGRNAQVYCDATIALPLIWRHFAKRKIQRNDPPDLRWFFSE